ncbi:MAG: hypothetical protein NC394_10520 [Bacteroides sp.]|nr:hypothetical protein [Bacteroides sp.]
MFSELERRRFYFTVGAAELYLRFDNRALLEAEKSGFDIFELKTEGMTVKAAKCFLSCGLRRFAEEKAAGEDPKSYADKLADRIVKASAPDEISAIIGGAVLMAMPEPIMGVRSGKKEKADLTRIFCYFCDIMGKPEELFWELTLREVLRRWDAYAVFHGYKEAPLEVKTYDD